MVQQQEVNVQVTHLSLPHDPSYALGNVQAQLNHWELITSDSVILGIIREGIKIDFHTVPSCLQPHPLCNLNLVQEEAVTGELSHLVSLGVITGTSYHPDKFVSGLFTTEKPDHSLRMILNLKRLNQFVHHIHFKMESLHDVLCLIQPGVWMGSVDLKDAYYSIPVHQAYKQYFTCYWQGRFYEYNRMPNGYAQAPLLFAKILKHPFARLRKQGLLSVVYLDDSYLQGDSYSGCLHNITATTNLLAWLGFRINYEKSVLVPTQSMKFLGFILDSVTMTISLTETRRAHILAICNKLQTPEVLTIREVASAIGTFVAALPAVPHGALHYRSIEKANTSALQSKKENFNKKMTLPVDALSDIFWWEQHVLVSFSPICRDAVHYTLYSDASLEGWGGTDVTTHVGGRWTDAEMPHHINVLELQAAYLTLQALGSDYRNVHIRLMLDNTTATTYINKMGGTHSATCNTLAKANSV